MAARTKANQSQDATVEQEARPAEKPTGLVVTARLVTARDDNGAAFSLMQGDVVTDRVSKDCLEHLQSLGFVEKQ